MYTHPHSPQQKEAIDPQDTDQSQLFEQIDHLPDPSEDQKILNYDQKSGADRNSEESQLLRSEFWRYFSYALPMDFRTQTLSLERKNFLKIFQQRVSNL